MALVSHHPAARDEESACAERAPRSSVVAVGSSLAVARVAGLPLVARGLAAASSRGQWPLAPPAPSGCRGPTGPAYAASSAPTVDARSSADELPHVPRPGLRRRPDLAPRRWCSRRRCCRSASASRPPSADWELFSQSGGRRGDHPAAARRRPTSTTLADRLDRPRLRAARRRRRASGTAGRTCCRRISAEPDPRAAVRRPRRRRPPGADLATSGRTSSGGRRGHRRRRRGRGARRGRRGRWASRCRRRSTPATTPAARWRWARPTPTTRRRPPSWSPPPARSTRTAFAMSVQPGRATCGWHGVRDDDQARTNADTRAALATGPGRRARAATSPTGSRCDSVTADGDAGRRWTCDPVDGAYVLSDLSTGPVLFATC